MPQYCRELRKGQINPAPRVRMVREEATAVIVDGDGGFGYLPTVLATKQAIARAKATGLGAGAVRHIGHYGAAGHYTRMCAKAGCIGFSVQGSAQPQFPDLPIALWGWPPMSFAIPAGTEPPIVLDGDTSFFKEHDLNLFERIPSVFFKSLGFTAVAKVLGGALVGEMLQEAREIESRWVHAFTGGFVLAIDVAHFGSEETFREEVDRLIRDIGQQMHPMPGYDRALLPGAIEAEREEVYRRDGVPVSTEIQQKLEETSKELGVPTPWAS